MTTTGRNTISGDSAGQCGKAGDTDVYDAYERVES